MINIEELRQKQADFEGSRQESKKMFEKLENERKEFLNRFPENKLFSMSIEEYSIGGEKSEKSFWGRTLTGRMKNIVFIITLIFCYS